MAQVVYGSKDTFDHMAFAVPTQQVFQSIDQNFHAFRSKLQEGTAQLFNTCQDIYRKVEYSDALRSVRAAARGVEMIWTSNTIQELNGIGALQHAPEIMRPYMMAYPPIRERYHDQTLYGYGDGYIDHEPGLVGEDHAHYRAVTSGIYMEQPNGDWEARVHFEHFPEEEKLNFTEQLDIMHAWDGLQKFLELDQEDPTSPINTML